tara:strand:- start:178 stop:384 length:207 start_codon:yes stop_codon:yes gene_type:complete
MGCNIKIKPRRNEPIARTIKRFIKKVKKEGIIEEVKDRRRYTKPSEKRRKAKKRSDARRKKELAKQQK